MVWLLPKLVKPYEQFVTLNEHNGLLKRRVSFIADNQEPAHIDGASIGTSQQPISKQLYLLESDNKQSKNGDHKPNVIQQVSFRW